MWMNSAYDYCDEDLMRCTSATARKPRGVCAGLAPGRRSGPYRRCSTITRVGGFPYPPTMVRRRQSQRAPHARPRPARDHRPLWQRPERPPNRLAQQAGRKAAFPPHLAAVKAQHEADLALGAGRRCLARGPGQEAPQLPPRMDLAMGLPRQAHLYRPRDRRCAPPPPSRNRHSARRPQSRHRCTHHQARHPDHAASFLRNPPPGRRIRHPHHPGTARPPRHQHDHDPTSSIAAALAYTVRSTANWQRPRAAGILLMKRPREPKEPTPERQQREIAGIRGPDPARKAHHPPLR